MQFRTPILIEKSGFSISHQSKMLFVGSCFSENIGSRLNDLKFSARINPFGVLYNPVSIKNCLDVILKGKRFEINEINENNGLWFSFSHHSSFSDVSADKCLEKINHEISISSDHIKKTDVLFLTFGTAMVYISKKNGRPVSNCHKLPASEFTVRMLRPEEIVSDYSELIGNLNALNPNIRIVFSISPVRYLKDGMETGNYSKSILNVAVHDLISQFDCCSYFPAFEILMDDLRDYRFYGTDMVHPSDQAVDYALEKFAECFFSDETMKINEEINKLTRACKHRFLTNNKVEITGFLKTQLSKAQTLSQKHNIDFIKEINYLENMLEKNV